MRFFVRTLKLLFKTNRIELLSFANTLSIKYRIFQVPINLTLIFETQTAKSSINIATDMTIQCDLANILTALHLTYFIGPRLQTNSNFIQPLLAGAWKWLLSIKKNLAIPVAKIKPISWSPTTLFFFFTLIKAARIHVCRAVSKTNTRKKQH